MGSNRGILALATGLFAILCVLAAPIAAQAQTAFYDASGVNLAGLPNGAVIRAEPMGGAPEGAAAYRILYRSEGLHDEPIAVSGVVIVPSGPAPAGGRPVVAWAHPTSGVEPQCAPSLALVFFRSIQGLRDMLARGYVVTATDYPGLGTPGPHPYLVGTSEGRAVLDSVRAARGISAADAGDRFAVWGHSQGGQAALFAGILARSYAPELHLVGVAAAAPATELGPLMKADLGTGGGNNLTAMTLWSWSRVYDAPMTAVVTPQAVPVIDHLASLCIERWFDMFSRRGPTQALERGFLRVHNLAEQQPFHALLAENTPGRLPPEIPVFLAQGTADKLVIPAITRNYAQDLCAGGSRVAFDPMPGVGHGFAGRDAANAAVAWIADRFADEPAPTSCGQLR